MKPATTRIIKGHAIDALKSLPDESVHLCVTSPPYFTLRNYGTPPQVWGDGWVGELGQEPTPEMFVGHLVEVFDAFRPALRDDGSLWVNLGDGYSAGGRGGNSKPSDTFHGHSYREEMAGVRKISPPGLKPKDLVGTPAMFKFAMRDDGWYLRSEIPWIKRNCMPSSVTDRPGVSHEWWYGFSKSPRYFWDVTATRTPQATLGRRHEGKSGYRAEHPSKGGIKERQLYPDGKARRTGDWFFDSLDVEVEAAREYLEHLERIRDGGQGLLSGPDGDPLALVVNVTSNREAHYAGFPEKLVEPLILAGTSGHGCCAECQAPWARVVDRERVATRPGKDSKVYEAPGGSPYSKHNGAIVGNRDPKRHCTVVHTRGWEPSCSCDTDEVAPAVILDPFFGSGTTGKVANRLGRSCIGIELGDGYVGIAERRVGEEAMPLFGATVRVVGVAREGESRP
jgi:DNA modification methylase